MLKFAFLGAWHSHASIHVREAAARPGEVELVRMYDPDPAVIQQNRSEETPDLALAHDRAVQRTLFKGCGITDGHALRT